jgi:hypothetical protein
MKRIGNRALITTTSFETSVTGTSESPVITKVSLCYPLKPKKTPKLKE